MNTYALTIKTQFGLDSVKIVAESKEMAETKALRIYGEDAIYQDAQIIN